MDIENIFKFVVIFFIFYFLFKVNSEKFTSTANISAEMKTAINTIYEADVGAIRTLSQISSALQEGGLTIPGNLKLRANLATNGLDPTNMPDGWGGGLRIFDGYASGTMGFGPDGKKLNAYMNSNGEMKSINMNTDNANVTGKLTTGDAVVNGILTAKSRIDAIRKDGRVTHFDWADGKNYIRGDTQHDNNLTVGSLTLRNGNWTEGSVEVSAQEGMYGNWTGLKMCPAGTYVCGLNTRFEGDQKSGDDTALNGIRMQCCKF
jgi:hypothetical protein